MKFRNALFNALGVSAMALGMQFASGRVAAVFYAQLAGTGWLGIAAGGICFGLMTGLTRALARRGGAQIPVFLPVRAGAAGLIRGLYFLILTAAACMLAGEAGHIGALTLPVHHAQFCGAAMALLLSAAAALSGRRAVLILGAIYGICLTAYLTLLLFAPQYAPGMNYALDLRLGNCIPAALLLALAHASVSACITAGLTSGCRAEPVRLGTLSGAAYALLLALGNGVFIRHEPILLRLGAPFTALASGWGIAGFYLSALMIFLGCAACLSGILYACISKRKSRFSDEN